MISSARAGEIPAKPFEYGYVKEFLAVGPFPAQTDEEKAAAWLGPSFDPANPDLSGEFDSPLAEGKVRWQEIVSSTAEISLWPGRGPIDYAQAYLCTALDCPGNTSAIAFLQPDDYVEIFVNGKYLTARGIGQHEVPIKLVKGRNLILLKSRNDTGGWSVSMEIRKPLRLASSVISPNDDSINDTLAATFHTGADTPEVEILKEGRKLAATAVADKAGAGVWKIGWDGFLDNGKKAPDGPYELVVKTADGSETYSESFEIDTRKAWKPSAAWPERYFPFGVFVDGNMVGGEEGMRAMCEDLKERGINTIMFTNQIMERDEPLLNVSDEYGIKVIFALTDLHHDWFQPSIPADERTAEAILAPMVERLTTHPSLAGYYTVDEPNLHLKDKLATLSRILGTLDPERPNMPCLIGLDRVDPIYQAAQPRVMLIDVYPCGFRNAPGDFTLTGFGYKDWDFVSYIREVTRNKSPETPLWIILQTHGFLTSLRAPSIEEVRLQTWLSLAENATGLIYFTYHTQQGWIGLIDAEKQPTPLFEEVTRLTRAISPHADLLLRLRPVPSTAWNADRFRITELEDPRTQKRYYVCCNLDVTAAARLTAPEGRRFRNLLTGKTETGTISLDAGGGVLLEAL